MCAVSMRQILDKASKINSTFNLLMEGLRSRATFWKIFVFYSDHNMWVFGCGNSDIKDADSRVYDQNDRRFDGLNEVR